ncbi:MAG: radical SAM protein [Peptococcaceae bacterium]|jgi:radical SAM superfamily enzyme YgiQ (UPF0313 family)|nr:radical SAM protein [Peptococcaceae bacterium]
MYVYPIYRPPSEATSLILQLTLGCSYNQCLFCSSFKNKPFHTRPYETIVQHIEQAQHFYPNPQRIFLADANVLCLQTADLLKYLALIKETFPHVERISSYGGPLDILRKSEDELRQIRAAGLDMLYMGVESGSAEVLKFVHKGVTPEEMIAAGQKVKRMGFTFSCMIISGLGGQEMWESHALGSARVISAINPDYFGLLTLIIDDVSPLRPFLADGSLNLLGPEEVMRELHTMVRHCQLDRCVFRANHASNYYSFKGVLNRDKDALLAEISAAIEHGVYRPESGRLQ